MRLRVHVSALLVAFVAVRGWGQPLYMPRPNPLCEAHLAIARPVEFRAGEGDAPSFFKHNEAVFADGALVVTQQVSVTLRITHDVEYDLWVRAGWRYGTSAPLRAELIRNGETFLTATLNDGPGAPDRGGPEGYGAYVERAVRNAPLGGAVTDINLAVREEDLDIVGGDDVGGALLDDIQGMLRDAATPSGERWIAPDRVDSRSPLHFTWWKIGRTALDAGTYTLTLQPAGDTSHITVPLVDAAFLTAYDKLMYPFSHDIAAPRASYIRFRIDEVPESGVTVRANINTHAYPYWNTPWAYLNPDGIPDERVVVPHRDTGFTAWYRLQDIERGPPVTSRGQMQLRLRLSPAPGEDAEVCGATQFAMYPYAGFIVREFDWNEPDGLGINMLMDFEKGLHHLKTYRDCAREHYELALTNAMGRLVPLTRHGLWVGGSGGGCTPSTQDYLCKTLRLLGYNIANVTQEPIVNRERYGWKSFAGHARMKWFSPLPDEEAPLHDYEDVYRPIFEGRPEFYEDCPVWQMVDEPGEAYRNTMTAPLWRYEADAEDGPRWVDYPGQSEFYTRSLAYSNCVLEGKIAKLGSVVRIMAGTDDSQSPSRYVYWRLGKVLPDTNPENFMSGKEGFETEDKMARLDPKAALGRAPVPFKVVIEKGYAGFFLNDIMLHQFSDAPLPGGFGFGEGSKAIYDLHIRPLRFDEHIAPQSGSGELSLDAGGPSEDAMGQSEIARVLARDEGGDSTNEPAGTLQAFIEDEWAVAGGYPEIHAAYRLWLQDRGVKPKLFGKKSWEHVSPLTLSNLIQDPYDARSFYWSRQYSAWLTPKTFSLAAEALRRSAPDKEMWSYVGLSGGYPNVYGCTIVDMFQLAAYTNGLMPGISDWYWYNADSQQVNAYSAAIFAAGARRYGKEPASVSMMHIVHPTLLRATASLADGVKYLSYYTFGPFCLGVGHDPWSETPVCYEACSFINNRVAQIDDLVGPGLPRPSRVALLWSQANDHWNQALSFKDKRSAFLALSHEYYQPDLVTEPQVLDGALAHYDALYVLEPYVTDDVQDAIADWVRAGGILWSCAESLTRNEYDEPADLLLRLCKVKRTFSDGDQEDPRKIVVSPVAGEVAFTPHQVDVTGMPSAVDPGKGRIRAVYDDGTPAWVEAPVGRGRVVYLAHRCGLTYRAQQIRYGWRRVWTDAGRALLTRTLHEAGVPRELVVSEPAVLARPLSCDSGTVVVMHNLQPAPCRKLDIALAEPASPHSVQRFDGLNLVDQPYTFEDGMVRIRLNELDKGQMLVVRRTPPPDDDRPEGMRRRTVTQLSSTQPMDLAAGAWFAGFHPEWALGDRLAPLLTHDRWEVRRSAAEAIARLSRVQDTDALRKAIERESDAHALGDELVALGMLGDSAFPDLALSMMDHNKPFVRMQAAAAMLRYASEAQKGSVAAVPAVVDRALSDPDIRIRREGIRLLALLDTDRLLEQALAAFSEDTPDEVGRPYWAEAIATSDLAFEAYLKRAAPGGLPLLLAVAGLRQDRRLTPLLVAQLEGATKENAAAWVQALSRQADPALARRLLDQRDELAPLEESLLYILSTTFDARPGNRFEDWGAWLEGRTAEESQ